MKKKTNIKSKGMSIPANLNYAWAELMIRELERLGVNTYFVAPGSRSSPLALSVADYGSNMIVHFDERGIGFAALGYARATGKPAVVITTSGSAVANLWPAVCESSMDAVPMLILSADRPPELRDTGSNQTMDQVKLFGSYVRWQVDMPCPDVKIPATFVLSTIDYAYSRSMQLHPGPVHINQMFRDPLAPVKKKDGALAWQKELGKWWNSNNPWTHYAPVKAHAIADQIRNRLAGACKGLITAGAMRREGDSDAILALAEKLGWPILPDIRSGLRLKRDHPNIIHMSDQVLLSDRFVKSVNPDVILHLGGGITSKRISQFVAKSSAELIMIHDMPIRIDPNNRVAMRLVSDVNFLINRQAQRKNGMDDFPQAIIPPTNRTPKSWLNRWKKVDRAGAACWNKYLAANKNLSEPAVAACISDLLPHHHALVLACSMPIRDMEMYGATKLDRVRISSNRGVSGIDGNVASAAGCAEGTRRPLTLVIGDLALLHDINSLSLVRNSPYQIIIVVINNDGGGIFSFLPVSQTPRHYETCFGTPHGLLFEKAAAMFNLDYAQPKSMEELASVYMKSIDSRRSSIIEIHTNRAENIREHRRIQMEIKKAIDHVSP